MIEGEPIVISAEETRVRLQRLGINATPPEEIQAAHREANHEDLKRDLAALKRAVELPKLEAMTTLSLKDGDTLVLMTNEGLTGQMQDCLGSSLRRLFPNNKCIVLERGMKLAVLQREEPRPDHKHEPVRHSAIEACDRWQKPDAVMRACMDGKR